MKILNLIIKQQYFDAIMDGSKVQEFREIRPTTYKKLVETVINEDGTWSLKVDENFDYVPVKYDAIQFYVGYNKDRDSALVEVKSAYTEVFVDEDNNVVTYDYQGEPWEFAQVVYNLGRVIEKDIHPKKRRK